MDIPRGVAQFRQITYGVEQVKWLIIHIIVVRSDLETIQLLKLLRLFLRLETEMPLCFLLDLYGGKPVRQAQCWLGILLEGETVLGTNLILKVATFGLSTVWLGFLDVKRALLSFSRVHFLSFDPSLDLVDTIVHIFISSPVHFIELEIFLLNDPSVLKVWISVHFGSLTIN